MGGAGAFEKKTVKGKGSQDTGGTTKIIALQKHPQYLGGNRIVNKETDKNKYAFNNNGDFCIIINYGVFMFILQDLEHCLTF